MLSSKERRNEEEMWKKILTISLALAVVLSFTAREEARLPSAQEIIYGVTDQT